jgi:hypothetical protein
MHTGGYDLPFGNLFCALRVSKHSISYTCKHEVTIKCRSQIPQLLF